MRRNSEPDLDSSWRPGDGVCDDQLLYPVLPDDPGSDPHRFAGRSNAGMGELLLRKRPRLWMRSPRYFGHLKRGIEQTFD